MAFKVDYQTGVEEPFTTIEDAQMGAEASASATGQDILVRDSATNVVVSRLPWFARSPKADEEVTLGFGEVGFYGMWTQG